MKRATQFTAYVTIFAAVIVCAGADSAPRFLIMQSVTPEDFRANHPFPPIHGPVYLRTEVTGSGSYSGSFSVPDANWTCSLVLTVDKGWRGPSTSLTLTLNGTVQPIDAASLTPGKSYATPIQTVAGNNALAIAAQSAASASLRFYIIAGHQNRSSALISPDGGSVNLLGIATVEFPQGAFEQAQSVTIGTSTSTWMNEQIPYLQAVFRAQFVTPYQVCINTGTSSPDSAVSLTLACPPQLMQAAGDTLTPFAFVRIVQVTGAEFLDAYDLLPCDFAPGTNTLSVTIPTFLFVDYPGLGGAYVADVLLGLAPHFWRPDKGFAADTSAKMRTCPDVALTPPLDSMRIAQNGAWYASRRDGREFPFHIGIDGEASLGTAVYSMAPGKVIWADNAGGYGRMVEIRHNLYVTTLYGHLAAVEVAVGQEVPAHFLIGYTGVTGYENCWALDDCPEHLHFELRDYEGRWRKKPYAPVNPWSCLYGFPRLSASPASLEIFWLRSFPGLPHAFLQILNAGEQSQLLDWRLVRGYNSDIVQCYPTSGLSNSTSVDVIPSVWAESLPSGPCNAGGIEYQAELRISSEISDVEEIGVPVSLRIAHDDIISNLIIRNAVTGEYVVHPKPNVPYRLDIDIELCASNMFDMNTLTASFRIGNSDLGTTTFRLGQPFQSPEVFELKNVFPNQLIQCEAQLQVNNVAWRTLSRTDVMAYDWEQALCGEMVYSIDMSETKNMLSGTVVHTANVHGSGTTPMRETISYGEDFCRGGSGTAAAVAYTSRWRSEYNCYGNRCARDTLIASSPNEASVSVSWNNMHITTFANCDSFKIEGLAYPQVPLWYTYASCNDCYATVVWDRTPFWPSINKWRLGRREYHGSYYDCATELSMLTDESGNDWPRIAVFARSEETTYQHTNVRTIDMLVERFGIVSVGGAGGADSVVGDITEHAGRNELTIRCEPNPFRGDISIMANAEAGSNVIFEVYDVMGRRVRALEGVMDKSGYAGARWDGRDGFGRRAPSGGYFVVFRNGAERRVKRIMKVQ